MRTTLKKINDSDAHRKIGQWLQEKRLATGLTQTQLASKLGRAQVVPSNRD